MLLRKTSNLVRRTYSFMLLFVAGVGTLGACVSTPPPSTHMPIGHATAAPSGLVDLCRRAPDVCRPEDQKRDELLMAQSPDSSPSTGAITPIPPPETSETFASPTLTHHNILENEDVGAGGPDVDGDPIDAGQETTDVTAHVFANNSNKNAASWKELFSRGLEHTLDSDVASPWHTNFEPALEPYEDLLANASAYSTGVMLEPKTTDLGQVKFKSTLESYRELLASASTPSTDATRQSKIADPWHVKFEPVHEPYEDLLANVSVPATNLTRETTATIPVSYGETLADSEPMDPIEADKKARIKKDDETATEDPTTALPSLDELYATIDRVNYKINTTIIPRTDKKNYGRSELWTLPLTFGRGRAGDCEDYALEKREALLKAGIPASSLFFAVGHSPATGRHAVLMIMTDQGDYVLDNMTSEIKPWFEAGYSWISRQSADDPLIWANVNS